MNQIPIKKEHRYPPGIVIAALRGGSGKTIFSVGMIAALRNLGKTLAPFKKGPDYIDAGWLALSAGRPCYNLDTFLIDQQTILKSFHTHTAQADFTLIEGNRGLYDCINTEGKTSTAELAKLLNLPVILCIDATKTTRTMAAVVSGMAAFDPEVRIGGVVLNRVAGPRHRNILTTSIEEHCHIPVVGAVPKLGKQSFPERHMGLVPTPEHEWAKDAVDAICRIAEKHLDIDKIIEIANAGRTQVKGLQPDRLPEIFQKPDPIKAIGKKPVICVLQDSAFQFYYPENLEALKNSGADLVFTSPLKNDIPPKMDGLYIGGGFPETHAKALADNTIFKDTIKTFAREGMPIYAECGGLMYLGEALVLDGETFKMAGVLPAVFGFSKRPKGHGYTIITIEKENPFYQKGAQILGHEFHYSSVIQWNGKDENLVFSMDRGTGFLDGKDGVCFNNVLATYTHIHALGTPEWAEALVRNALAFLKRKG